MNHEFVIYTGPMYGGKSSSLLAYVDRAKTQRRKICVFKPTLDDRFDIDQIVTHGGMKHPAIRVKSGAELFGHVIHVLHSGSVDVVAVDEAFMIEGSAQALIDVFKLGCSVVVSSLDMSAQCTPYAEIVSMMPWATKIEKIPSVCDVCMNDAYYTCSFSGSLDQGIKVGGRESYAARCMLHHPVLAR